MMRFTGGFDPAEHVLDLTKPTSFLAFVYPIDNYEELRQQLRTLDYAAIPKSCGLETALLVAFMLRRALCQVGENLPKSMPPSTIAGQSRQKRG
jgi:hypothetical protein